MLFFVRRDDKSVGGPYTYRQILGEVELTPETMVTTDSLGGDWYEAKCFECLDSRFDPGFAIGDDGVIHFNGTDALPPDMPAIPADDAPVDYRFDNKESYNWGMAIGLVVVALIGVAILVGAFIWTFFYRGQ